MAFCVNCGKELAEGAKFCFECGAAVGVVVIMMLEKPNMQGKL